MLERVLVPLDGSETAEAVLPLVRTLKPAEVVVMRAAGRATDEESHRYVAAQSRQLAGLKIRAIVREGSAPEAILAAADEVFATMILMGTHGRTGLSRFTFGSVAEKVARAGHLPVMMLRTRKPPAKDFLVRRILVPMDGSETALGIIPYVVSLARHCVAQIVVLHVTELSRLVVGAVSGEVVDRPDLDRRPPRNPSIEEMLRYASERFAEADVRTVLTHVRGDAAVAILDYAQEHLCDVIAMATHGRSGISRWTLGSVAEKVLRHATMPTLTVRPWRTP